MRLLLPDMADHCLVFHRGLDTATATGLFINEKIELLLSYLLMEPVGKVRACVRKEGEPLLGAACERLIEDPV